MKEEFKAFLVGIGVGGLVMLVFILWLNPVQSVKDRVFNEIETTGIYEDGNRRIVGRVEIKEFPKAQE